MIESAAPGWVPFSHRYGIAGPTELVRWCSAGPEDFQEERWRTRHHLVTSAFADVEESGVFVAPLLRCTCPGGPELGRCAERASQEDRLCDRCRAHCWAGSPGFAGEPNKHVRLVDLYGMAGPLS